MRCNKHGSKPAICRYRTDKDIDRLPIGMKFLPELLEAVEIRDNSMNFDSMLATAPPQVWSNCGRRLDLNGTKVSEEQLKQIKASFNQIDRNRDGRISATELIKAQRVLGFNPTRKEVQQMIKTVDGDESGFIELSEYIRLMSERMGALDYEKQQMKAAFMHLDQNGSGKLSREELRRFVTSGCGEPLTEEEFNNVMNDIDQDGDGQIDIEEFCEMLCQRQDA